MNIIKSIFKSRDTPKNHMGDNVGGGRYFPFGRTWAGKSVTERTAMQITAVYACCLLYTSCLCYYIIDRKIKFKGHSKRSVLFVCQGGNNAILTKNTLSTPRLCKACR